MNIKWSKEISFSTESINSLVPSKPGIYKILQSKNHPRYFGETCIVKIGMSESDLHKEISNHFNRHTSANRLARIRNRSNIQISIIFGSRH